MEGTIYCLVDVVGNVRCKDGADSYSAVAAEFDLDEGDCLQFRYDLTTRRLLPDLATPSGGLAAKGFLNERIGTPRKLMAFAEEGHLPKRALATLLTYDKRREYLEACAALEKRFTEECTASNDPCLASGCAVEGEICLQPLMAAEVEYHKACAAEWAKRFRNPENRIDVWRE